MDSGWIPVSVFHTLEPSWIPAGFPPYHGQQAEGSEADMEAGAVEGVGEDMEAEDDWW